MAIVLRSKVSDAIVPLPLRRSVFSLSLLVSSPFPPPLLPFSMGWSSHSPSRQGLHPPPHPNRKEPHDTQGGDRRMAWTTVRCATQWKKHVREAVARVVGQDVGRRWDGAWKVQRETYARGGTVGTWMHTRGFATTHAKLKTPSGLKDRFKVTGTGKYVHAKSGHQHLAYDKSSKRKRNLRQPAVVHKAWARVMKLLGHR